MKRKRAALALCAAILGTAILAGSCQSPEKIREQAENAGNENSVIINHEMVEQKRLVIASGAHTIYADPDYALVTFAVSAPGDTDLSARDACSEKAAPMTALLRTMGEVSTDVISVKAAYDYTQTPPAAAGSVATQKFLLKLTDVGLVRKAMAYALQAGADEARDVGFYVSDGPEQHKAALGYAIENATKNALMMAADAGVMIDIETPVQMQLATGEGDGPFSLQVGGVFTADSLPERIEVPSFSISAAVEMSFEIKVPEETE